MIFVLCLKQFFTYILTSFLPIFWRVSYYSLNSFSSWEWKIYSYDFDYEQFNLRDVIKTFIAGVRGAHVVTTREAGFTIKRKKSNLRWGHRELLCSYDEPSINGIIAWPRDMCLQAALLLTRICMLRHGAVHMTHWVQFHRHDRHFRLILRHFLSVWRNLEPFYDVDSTIHVEKDKQV